MQTVIVTGVSGAGKTQAIDYLEDLGFFCIDNMPIQLLPKFMELSIEAGQSKVAVVTDIRSIVFGNNMPQYDQIAELKEKVGTKVIYLDADEPTIIRRYQQSRRRHPLTSQKGSLERALEMERIQMKGLREAADEVIDTSELRPGDLYERLLTIFGEETKPDEMQLNIISFGFKYGTPRSADFVFDARFLPNPFYIDELKPLTGEDKEVRDYVMNTEVAQNYMDYIADLLETIIPSYIKIDKTHLTVAFGCTGGQHRSVTFAYLLAERFEEKGYSVSLEHRDIKKDRERQ